MKGSQLCSVPATMSHYTTNLTQGIYEKEDSRGLAVMGEEKQQTEQGTEITQGFFRGAKLSRVVAIFVV